MYDSKLEKDFHTNWRRLTRITITPQHIFHPRRKWRFDFAHLESKTAIEIQGFGTGHASYSGMRSDYFKHNEAVRLGWSILYFMSSELCPKKISKTIGYIEHIINTRLGNAPTETEVPIPESKYDAIIRKLRDGR